MDEEKEEGYVSNQEEGRGEEMRPLPKWHTHPNEPTSILIMMSTERERALLRTPFSQGDGRTFSYFITTSVGQPSKIAAGRKSAPKNSG